MRDASLLCAEEDDMHHGDVSKDFHIPLIPKLLSCEHEEGGECLSLIKSLYPRPSTSTSPYKTIDIFPKH
jgi:hypothetical protein